MEEETYLKALAYAAYMNNWFSRTMDSENLSQTLKITCNVAAAHAYQLDTKYMDGCRLKKEKEKEASNQIIPSFSFSLFFWKWKLPSVNNFF